MKSQRIKSKKSTSMAKNSQKQTNFMMSSYKNNQLLKSNQKIQKKLSIKQNHHPFFQPPTKKSHPSRNSLPHSNLRQNQSQLKQTYSTAIKNIYQKTFTSSTNPTNPPIKNTFNLSQPILYFLGSIFQKIKNNNTIPNYNQFILQCQRIYNQSTFQDISYFIQTVNQQQKSINPSTTQQNPSQQIANPNPVQPQKKQLTLQQNPPLKQLQNQKSDKINKIQFPPQKISKQFKTIQPITEQQFPKTKQFLSNIPITTTIQSKQLQQTPFSIISRQYLQLIMKNKANDKNNTQKYINLNQTQSRIKHNNTIKHNNPIKLKQQNNKPPIQSIQKIPHNYHQHQQLSYHHNQTYPIINFQQSIKYPQISSQTLQIKLKTSRIQKQTDRLCQLSFRLDQQIKNNAIKIENSKNVRNLL